MPQRLGRYAVRRRIGNGAFATVWLAYDEQLDSPVAVKVLADNWTADDHIRRRFVEEGRYLRKVESTHVVSVYDAGELDDGRPYLVMSYADQGTLADRLKAEALSPAQALEVVRQVGSGLTALHERGIVHRDVKPANVLFRTVDGRGGTTLRAMLGDLGLGKALDGSSRLTMVAGTPAYVAPEQARGESPDARADQYSLAAMTYLMLTGRAPFVFPSMVEAGHPGPVPDLSTEERQFPVEVETVVRRGLASDREDRYPDVESYVAALDAALFPLGGDAAPLDSWLPVDPDLTQPGPRPSETGPGAALADPELPPPPGRSWRRLLAVGTAALVALAVGVGAGFALQRQQTPPDPTLQDATKTLSVTVPADWAGAVADEGWSGPDDDGTYPALSVGTSAGWNQPDSRDEGVFVGLLRGTRLPPVMPQHPECATAGDRSLVGSTSATVVYSDCPGGVTVERVVQISSDRLVWIQIRSRDRDTAESVLDSVDTSV